MKKPTEEIGNNPPKDVFVAAHEVVGDKVGVPEAKWFVAIVNPRHEKKVADNLAALGYITFVASQKERRIWKNGRKKIIDRMVIPSVVFIKCTEQERRQIVALPYIIRFMVNRAAFSGTLNKPPAIIPDNQIERLRFMLGQSEMPVNFIPTLFKIKDSVRVIRGKLIGLTGEIIRQPDGSHSLTVALSLLGGASVTIDPTDVEKIP